MDPEEAKLVCVPIFVTLFWVAVAKVPVRVAPETSVDAATDPVTVKLPPVMAAPAAEIAPEDMAPAVRVPAVVRLSAVTVPVKTVLPTLEDPILVKTLETGSPLTVKLVQETEVAETSTASTFFTTAFIVVGTYRGL